jgi:carboxyl-terminal processing protease
MKFLPFSKVRTIVLLVALVILSSGIGYRLGERKASLSLGPNKQVIINQKAPNGTTADFSLFWNVWQRLFESYIDKGSMDVQKMTWGAISGMVSSLGDPYTVFLPPKENKDFKEDLGGAFEGIGAQLGLKESRISVIAPLKGMPAEAAGIKPGDYILKVNDEDTTGWTVNEAVSKIRGPKGTSVTLNILHDTATKAVDVSVVRNTITVPSVDAWVKTAKEITEISGLPSARLLEANLGKIAYIALSRFGDRTNDEWNKAVSDMVDAKNRNGSMKGLILDLRNNPGGYLDGSVFIASEFIKSGIVVSQVNSDGTKEDYRVMRVGKLLDIPLVVLINKGSASASEIVAGALRDFKRATIIGETSYGKGSVQTPEDLPGGSSVHITTGKWLLPKGDSISKVGVKPDILVEMEDATATTDAQLAKAVELLLK